MADQGSLIALEKSVKPAAKPTPPSSAKEPGDSVFDRARAAHSDPDAARLERLFAESNSLLEAKLQTDEVFGHYILPKLDAAHPEAVKQLVIDEADKLKIEELKKVDPRFGSGEAAVAGLVDEALFGQLDRLLGTGQALYQGRPIQEVIDEKAEEFRLLKKAHPTSDLAGRVGSYLIPYSLAGRLFGKAAGLAGKAALKGLGRSGTTLAGKAAASAASAATGTASVEFVRGVLGEGPETISLDRGVDNALSSGVMAGIFGAGISGAASALPEITRAVKPTVQGAANKVRNTVANVLEASSGTDKGAIRAFNKDPRGLRVAAMRKEADAEAFRNLVYENHFSTLPEVQEAKKLLPKFGGVDIRQAVSRMKGFGKQTDPALDADVARLQEWGTRLESLAENGKLSADRLGDEISKMQNAAKYGQANSSWYNRQVMKTAADLRLQLNKTAAAAGPEGESYLKLMQQAAGKRRVLDYVGRKLGRNTDDWGKRSQDFLRQTFGANQNIQQARLKQLDERFGTNFFENAEKAAQAAKLGEQGVPGILPSWRTGRALFPIAAGGAIGYATGDEKKGAAVGAVLSSPRAAALLIGSSDKITGFVRKMLANPETIHRLARQAGKSGLAAKTEAQVDRAQRQMLDFRVPAQVQVLAREVSEALIKDGPISAASTLRVIADTPYFVGLVHAYDLAEQKYQRKQLNRPSLVPSKTETAVQPKGNAYPQ